MKKSLEGQVGLDFYSRFLGLDREIDAKYRQITLGEGKPPLVRSRIIGPSLGLRNLFFLNFTGEPTFSYKSWFAACAVWHMLQRRQKRALLTSSGNTGSAVAAYCSCAELDCKVVVAQDIPEAKLDKMRAFGAEIVRVKGFGRNPEVDRQVFEMLQRLSNEDTETALLVSSYKYSEDGMKGAEAVAYRLAQDPQLNDLGRLDHIFCPAGGGGFALATMKGFKRKGARFTPRTHIVQPAGCNTIVADLRRGGNEGSRVRKSTTIVSGLSVPVLLDARGVIEYARESGGTGYSCTDRQILDAQGRIARDGILTEPAGAASVAGLYKAVREGRISRNDVVVCFITGATFNDMKTFGDMAAKNGGSIQTVGIKSLERVLTA